VTGLGEELDDPDEPEELDELEPDDDGEVVVVL
jgi:hypothetical protein